MAEKFVEVETRDGVATVTLNNPPLNILKAAMMVELGETFGALAADRSLKAVAVKANGKAFSAGADVEEHRPEKAAEMIAAFDRLFERIFAFEVPLVMAVQGAALGAGFELAMMADVLIATERATFGQPEIRIGFLAPVGVAYLPARIGLGRAIEITCSGRTYNAATMKEWGLVSEVVPADGLDGALEKVLADFRRASPLVMRLNVRTLKRVLGRPFEEARREAERVFLEELMPSEDVREGIASFFEKRAAAWKNR